MQRKAGDVRMGGRGRTPQGKHNLLADENLNFHKVRYNLRLVFSFFSLCEDVMGQKIQKMVILKHMNPQRHLARSELHPTLTAITFKIPRT